MLIERPFPGATTCILVGPSVPELTRQLTRHTQVLWFSDATSPAVLSDGAAPGSLQFIAIDSPTAADPRAVIDRFVARHPRRLPSIFVNDAFPAQQAAAYAHLTSELYFTLEGHHRARVTRQRDGFTWQRHLLANAAAYAGRRLPREWAGALRGWPAFVCGAGPSLDISAPALARAAGPGILFAADSALLALAKLGLAADFAVSIDAAKVPEKCLPPNHPPTRVVLSAISPPAWTRTVAPAKQVFLSSNQVTLDWLAAHGIERTAVSVAENCGATALELARFLGCSPIYLFGMDLALDDAEPARRNASAADATLYRESGFTAQQAFPRVPGNVTATVPTHVIGDWKALDERLATWPPGLVSNVNDRGARLRNTALLPPSRFSIAVPPASKAPPLAQLPGQVLFGTPRAEPTLQRLRELGSRGCATLPSLVHALDKAGPAALALELRRLFAEDEFSRGLGAFSLKVMPHLIPPIEGTPASWHQLLDELKVLCEVARDLGPSTER